MTTIAKELPRPAVDFDALFRRYYLELNSFAYGRLKDREAAADLVQDAFVRYIVLDQGRSDIVVHASPRFFLWRIAVNLTVDVMRRKRRRGAFASLDDVASQLADPTPIADRCLEARQQFALLKAALDELPSAHRNALLMNRIEGLSHAEIGERLGVSASMVSKYIMSVMRHCTRRMQSRWR